MRCLSLQGFNHKRLGLPFSRAADPPEVLVLVSTLVALNFCFAGLMVSPQTPADVSTNASLSVAPQSLSRRVTSVECRT
jgi:hypothetical protein